MQEEEPLSFEVDTGLFRQLGELLVGRDSTAIIELVKNAYDADASLVVLSGRNLQDPDSAVLDVMDDGHGMTRAQFRSGFLRLAARGKAGGNKRSPIFGRRYTGEKGVGRLAAHKLGGHLEVTSVAATRDNGEALSPDLPCLMPDTTPLEKLARLDQAKHEQVIGSIDWDIIEQHETISASAGGLRLPESMPASALVRGTALQISRLRHAWSTTDIQDLGVQLLNFEPPQAVVGPVSDKIAAYPGLFTEAKVRDTARSDPGMKVELEGDLRSPAEHWTSVTAAAEWILEVQAERGQDVRYRVYPTNKGTEENRFAQAISISVPHPRPEIGPFFESRIFLRPGSVATLERTWSEQNSGIRIYLEGFRVLPYGEAGNDWLSLDGDYTRRSGRVDIDPLAGGLEDDLLALRDLKRRDVNLRLQPNRNFFGAVFLTDADSGGLRTLVNREGFVPDEAFETLTTVIRSGLNILHRSWALAGYRLKAEALPDVPDLLPSAGQSLPSAEDQPVESGTDDLPDSDSWLSSDDDVRVSAGNVSRGSAAEALAAFANLKQAIPERDADRAELNMALTLMERSVGRVISDASLMRVLASVGAQLSSVTHEVGHLLPIAQAAEADLVPQEGERWPARVSQVRRSVTELRRAIERQASYLSDVSSGDARRRRSRLYLRERVEAALTALGPAIGRAGVDLALEIEPSVKTSPMFRADLQSILSNVISNAIKATPKGGKISIQGFPQSEGVTLRIENTGDGVDVETSEQWFMPFASTSANIDPSLGQGMGLGLTITRELVHEHGGRIRFVDPTPGFDTCIQVDLD